MESDNSAQQREQQSLMAVICKSLKEEHQAELQKSQRYMAQVQENTESSLSFNPVNVLHISELTIKLTLTLIYRHKGK